MLCGGEQSGGRGEDGDLEKINDKTSGKSLYKNIKKSLHKNCKIGLNKFLDQDDDSRTDHSSCTAETALRRGNGGKTKSRGEGFLISDKIIAVFAI